MGDVTVRPGDDRPKDKLRVMQIIATLVVGGAESQLCELVKGLNKEKYEVSVCCLTRGGPLKEKIEELGIPVYILGKRNKLDFTVLFRLVSLLKRKKVDLVHTWMFTANMWGRLAAMLARIPCRIASERNVALAKGTCRNVIDKVLAGFTDLIIANSEGVKNSCLKAGLPSEKLIVIPNSCDLARFDQRKDQGKIKSDLGIRDDSLLVGTVGNFKPQQQKGQQFLIQAAPEVLSLFPEAIFILVGDGPQREKIERLAVELSISEKVRFLGQRRDVPDILSCLDVFVLPSLYEGLPNVVLEAMACRLPVVGTDVGGTNELVLDGQTGILVPPKDPERLAEAIVTLLRDKGLTRRMAEAGRKRVEEEFSLERMVNSVEEVYDRLTRKKLR
ncbi:MAG: glycosyltransferase [bacterium]